MRTPIEETEKRVLKALALVAKGYTLDRACKRSGTTWITFRKYGSTKARARKKNAVAAAPRTTKKKLKKPRKVLTAAKLRSWLKQAV